MPLPGRFASKYSRQFAAKSHSLSIGLDTYGSQWYERAVRYRCTSAKWPRSLVGPRQGTLRVYTDAMTQTTSFMLASGGVSIDFDRTVLLQMALFVLLMLILAPTLFGPLMRLFEEREKRTEGARAEAREMQERAGDLLMRYQAELSRVQHVATVEREKLRNETLRLEAKILEEARLATSAIVEQGRQHLSAEVAKIRAELDAKGQQISAEIAASVMGREVRS